jgi:hypothetical protein
MDLHMRILQLIYMDFGILSAFDGSAEGSLVYILQMGSCNWCDALIKEFSPECILSDVTNNCAFI